MESSVPLPEDWLLALEDFFDAGVVSFTISDASYLASLQIDLLQRMLWKYHLDQIPPSSTKRLPFLQIMTAL